MTKLSKEDLKESFSNNTKGRLYILFLYFRDEFLDENITAPVIVNKVAREVDINITKSNVYFIRKKYAAKSAAQSPLKAPEKSKTKTQDEIDMEKFMKMKFSEPPTREEILKERYGDYFNPKKK